MAHFPMFISLAHKKCLVIGAGKVALRKIKTLLLYEADLVVASLAYSEEVKDLSEQGRIHLYPLDKNWGEAEGERNASLEEELESLLPLVEEACMVIAASGDHALNREIGLYCRKQQIPVNVIDAPELCSFVFPSVILRGDISIGINTGQKSPALSKQIRKLVEEAIPDSYASIGDQLSDLRDYVKAHYGSEKDRRAILTSLAAACFEKDRPLTKEEIAGILAIDSFDI